MSPPSPIDASAPADDAATADSSSSGASSADAPQVDAARGNASEAGTWSLPSGAVYIKPSNTRPSTVNTSDAAFAFGHCVSLQGDTLVVGVRSTEPSAASGVDGDQSDRSVPFAGAAYVFTRSGGAWSQQAYVKPTPGGRAGRFGWSASLDGDTLVVGAPEDPAGGTAYVFVRSGGAWTQQATLSSIHAADGQRCGDSVAVRGDTIAQWSCPRT